MVVRGMAHLAARQTLKPVLIMFCVDLLLPCVLLIACAQFVREYPGSAEVRQDLQIATKFAPYPYRIGVQSIIQACDETLERVEADVSIRRMKPRGRAAVLDLSSCRRCSSSRGGQPLVRGCSVRALATSYGEG